MTNKERQYEIRQRREYVRNLEQSDAAEAKANKENESLYAYYIARRDCHKSEADFLSRLINEGG